MISRLAVVVVPDVTTPCLPPSGLRGRQVTRDALFRKHARSNRTPPGERLCRDPTHPQGAQSDSTLSISDHVGFSVGE